MRADLRPERVILRAELKPKWSDFEYMRGLIIGLVDFGLIIRLDKANFGPVRPDLGPERADLAPDRHDKACFGPKRSFGGDRRMDRRTYIYTDRRLEIHPCVLQDIGPLGPLPCSHSIFSANLSKQGIGYR